MCNALTKQIKSMRKDLSCENEPIRASRLSNREVMLSAAVLHNLNTPSSSTSGEYRNNRRLSSVSSGTALRSNDRILERPNQRPANCINRASISTEDGTDASNDNDNENENDNDNDNDTTNDDISLSQYELDVVNKYLNELCNCDQDENESNDLDVNLSEQLTGSIDSSDDSLQNQTDQCNLIDMSVELKPQTQFQTQTQTQTQSQTLSQSQSQSLTQSQYQDTPSSLAPFLISSKNDEIQCTQTSRPFGFDQSNQSNQSNAMINQNRNADSGHTHNDVNNNNISLSSNTDSHTVSQHRYSSGHRRYGSNLTTNTNAMSNSNRISANLPIIVGITSCVWGLLLYAVKSFYSDFT